MHSIFRIPMLLLLLFAALLSAQEAEYVDQLGDDEQIANFERDVSVRLQLIDVSVTDDDGNYVTNLTRDDFSVLVNGRQVPIKTFDAYFTGKGPSIEDMASGVIPNASSPTRRLVLFFDQAFSSFQGFRRSKHAALEFVKRSLSPGDEVMVVSYARSFKIHTEFTRDRDALISAIENMNYMPVGSRRGEVFASENVYEVRMYLKALEDLSLYLDSWRGRKSFIMLSEGFAQSIAIYNLSSFLQDMVDQFKSANTTIFSIDVSGLSSGRAFSPRLVAQRRDTLSTFALETGGKFYQGSNDIESILLNIDDDISNYYVLGITVPADQQGRFQEVEIDTRRPDLDLNYADGFYTPKTYQQLNGKEKVVHLNEGFNLSSPIKEFPAGFGVGVFPRNDGSAVASAVIRVPGSGKKELQEYEVRGIVINNEGSLIDGFHSIYQFESDADFYTEQYLNLDPGENLIKMVIRDNLSGDRNYQFIRARMPSLGDGIHISSLLFTRDEQHGQEIFRSKYARSKDYRDELGIPVKQPANPFSSVADTLVLDTDPVVTPSAEHGIVMKVSGLANRSQPQVDLKFTARDKQGIKLTVPVSSKVVRTVPGTGEAIVTAQLDFSDLSEGEYLLQLTLEIPAQDRVAGQQKRITVVEK